LNRGTGILEKHNHRTSEEHMGTENISGRASRAYSTARDNQHVRRLIEDEELRASLIAAALAGAADSLRDGADRLKAPAKKKRHPIRKLLFVGIITGGLVLAFSESARKSLLDAIFGAEEEFVYTSTTSTESAQTNGTPVGE